VGCTGGNIDRGSRESRGKREFLRVGKAVWKLWGGGRKVHLWEKGNVKRKKNVHTNIKKRRLRWGRCGPEEWRLLVYNGGRTGPIPI